MQFTFKMRGLALLLNLVVQAYFLENCVQLYENSKIRKYKNSLVVFQILISTSEYLRSTVYRDLFDSAKVHHLERTFRDTASLNPTQFSTFSGCTRRKV